MNVQEIPLDLQEFEDSVSINGKIILVSEHVEYIYILWMESVSWNYHQFRNTKTDKWKPTLCKGRGTNQGQRDSPSCLGDHFFPTSLAMQESAVCASDQHRQAGPGW